MKPNLFWRVCLLFSISLLFYTTVQAQPFNDNCSNASVIQIPSAGHAVGVFSSVTVSLNMAGREPEESFPALFVNSALDRKSVWYKFSIPVNRQVFLTLKQRDTAIVQNAAGFAIYKTGNNTKCPDQTLISNELLPINQFGRSVSQCLKPGDYLVQVCARNNVNDSVFLQLDLSDPSPLGTNDYKAWAKKVSTIAYSELIYWYCYGVESAAEVFQSGQYTFTQSLWYVVNRKPGAAIAFGCNYPSGMLNNLSNGPFAYRVYRGDVKSSPNGIIPLDSGVLSIGSKRYFASVCSPAQDSIYTIQLIALSSDFGKTELFINNEFNVNALSANPAAIAPAHRLGALSNVFKTAIDNFGCNAFLKDNKCGTVINSDIYRHWSWAVVRNLVTNSLDSQLQYQDYDMSTWMTFTVLQEGPVTINTDASYPLLLRIFSGDVSSSCNLTEFTAPKDGCWPPGNYSMQLLTQSQKGGLNRSVSTSIAHFKKVNQPLAFNDTRSTAEELGDITATLLAGSQVNTPVYTFGGADDSIAIKGVKHGNRVLFTTFHLSQPMTIQINSGIGIYLLKGNARNANDVLSTIDSRYGFFEGGTELKSNCNELDSGWYTIVCIDKLYPCQTLLRSTGHSIKKLDIISEPKYNRPYKAYAVNGGNPLSWRVNSGTAQYPKTRSIYPVPLHYFGCASDSPMYAGAATFCDPNMNTINYYILNVQDDSTFLKIRWSIEEKNFWSYELGSMALYRGDIRTDSTLLFNQANRVDTCNGIQNYCNLKAGVYTLVAFRGIDQTKPSPLSFMFSVVVDKSYISAFDHAVNAYDFGLITPGPVEKVSPPDFISCTTGAASSDPGLDTNFLKASLEPDYGHHPNVVKNIWYSFVVAGAGTIVFTPRVYKPSAMAHDYSMRVLRSDEKTGRSLAQLKLTGGLDSTLQSGLTTLFAIESMNTNAYLAPIRRSICEDTTRYYVMLQNSGFFRDNYQLQLGIQYTAILPSPKGDSASNPVVLSTSLSNTNLSASANIECNTIGESFGEDGSNMGCMGSPVGMKSTWFKFSYTGTQKVDISFKVNSSEPLKTKYRLLFGNPGHFIPAICATEASSSFRIDCMGAGDYYIQVLSPKGAIGSLSLSVGVQPTTYAKCKYFDASKPFAHFTADGGCSPQQVIKFSNFSSGGNNIIYNWDFDNGSYSQLVNPQVLFAPQSRLDTFQVKLVVKDTVLNKQDSAIFPVYVFRDTLTLDAGSDRYVNCLDSVITLVARSNYPELRAAYAWQPDYLFKSPYSDSTQLKWPANANIKVTYRFENCLATDSVRMFLNNRINIFGDSVIVCHKGFITLQATPGFDSYVWSTSQTGQAIPVIYPGTYAVRAYKNKTSCQAYDTIVVTGDSSLYVNLGPDIDFCKEGELKVLKIPYSTTEWSNGTSGWSLVVDTPGVYWARVKGAKCTVTDTVVVGMNLMSVNLGADRGGCKHDTITFIPITTGKVSSYLWSTGDSNASITVKDSGLYILKVSHRNCSALDTVHIIKEQLNVKLGPDRDICKHDSVMLQGQVQGAIKSYLWSTGDTTAQIVVHDSGLYILGVSTGKCLDFDSVRVNKHLLKVFLGADTSLCQSDSFFLRSQVSANVKKYEWSSGETTPHVMVHKDGTYSLKVSNDHCAETDTIRLRLYKLSLSLGNDRGICPGDVISISALDSGLISKRLWSTGDTSKQILVSQVGLYKLIIGNGSCELSDSVLVYNLPPLPVKLPDDTIVCPLEELSISATQPFSRYSWSTGENTPSIVASKPGYYWLRAYNGNCSGIDSMLILNKQVEALNIGNDTSFCGTFSMELSGQDAGRSYYWYPSGSVEQYLQVNNFGTYILNEMDSNGCMLIDSIQITENCEPYIFVPTAFSPNKNGLNEGFKVVCSEPSEFQLLVYNRWGELLFGTTDPAKAWDGTYQGEEVPEAAYTWLVVFKGKNPGDQRKSLKGTVTLLR